jgi:hypothetical protein
MKRQYIMIMLGLLFASTFANAAITVKFHKPDSWTAVSLYTWGPEVLGGWPGAPLTEVDGWYEYTFDEAFTGANLIFNNGEGTQQTEDFVISSSVCLEAENTLNTNGKYNISVVSCDPVGWTVKFHKPDSWTAVSLYTWGPEVLGGWPGAPLDEVDGWYVYTFDAAFTGANLIFNNGGMGEQTVDYVISGDVCLEASDTPNNEGKYDITVVPCNPAGWVVRFIPPDSWTAVSLYTWDPEVLGPWPGATLTEVEGWYQYTFDGTFAGANLIFNNGGQGEQTEDYTISGDVCLQASNTLNTNGKYDVTVIDCTTGLNEKYVTNLVKVYPNPVASNISIKGTTGIDQIRILTMTGEEALLLKGDHKNIDASTLQPGVYFMRIEFGNGSVQLEKIVKM